MKIKDTSKPYPKIIDSSRKYPKVDRAMVARELGAEIVPNERIRFGKPRNIK